MVRAFRLNHAVIGLAGEVGELASQMQKHLYYQRPLDLTNVKEEAGDILWYLALLFNTLCIDFGDVMESNIAKLRKRFPDKFCLERVKEENRDRAEEAAAVEAFLETELSPGRTLAFRSNQDPETQDMPFYCCSQKAEGLPCSCSPSNRPGCGSSSGV